MPTCTRDSLAEAAKCLTALDQQQLKAILVYLLCQIANGSGGGGTVTSVDGSGGTTGLTLSGGPIVTAGTLTLGGTLAVSNGGTGGATAAAARSGIGLGNVDNTSDANKPVSTAQATAIALKLAIASNLSDVANAVTALSNLGGIGAATTNTLTNKRVTQRVETLADAATVTPSSDSFDGGLLATLSQNSTIANPSGTPTNFQQYVLRIKSTSARTLTWGSQFRGSTDVALPSTTSGSSLTDYFGFQWNSADSKWDLVGKIFGF